MTVDLDAIEARAEAAAPGPWREPKNERHIGASCLNGQFLDELDPERGNYATEPKIECSLLCALAEDSYDRSHVRIVKP